MKTSLILGIAIAVVAVVAVGYLSLSGMMVQQNAEEILQSAADNVAGIQEYSITYGITNSVTADSDELTMQGEMAIAYNPFGEKLSVRMQSQAGNTAVDIYNLPEGTFGCQAGLSGIACERLNETLQVQNPVGQAMALLQLSHEGFVNIQPQGSRMVLGRRCDAIAFIYDIPKLLANASLPEDTASSITEMLASMCFDSQTGMPLDYGLTVKAEAETSMTQVTRMTATSFELSAPEIALPENATIY